MLLEYQIWQVVSSTILLIARLRPIKLPQRFSPEAILHGIRISDLARGFVRDITHLP